MIIRALTEADAEAYRRLRLRALQDHPDVFGRAYEEAESPDEVVAALRSRNDATGRFVLGAFDPELVGIVACSREAGVKRRHKALIWGMYVAPEARSRGVGRLLVEEAVARARRWSGLAQLWLSVAVHNEPARALYRSCGFQVFGLERRALRLVDRDVDEEHMVLHLDETPDAHG
ncbi:MAG: GNAT family N-acetyltransferase [Candidatus Rokuibacteriota bacterium]